jgi:hypothetical protein
VTYEALLSAFTQMALVVVGVPALAFAFLGGLAGAARSKHHNAESGMWFGVRLGFRIMPYVGVPYLALALWSAYPHLLLLAVAVWGLGDGAVHPNRRGFVRLYRRDVRWLRRETAPTAREFEKALRRTADAAGERAKAAGKAAPRRAWRGARWAGRHAKKATDTDPPSAMGWLFHRHRDDDSPGRAARRDRIEARIADRLTGGSEPRERPTLDQRLARWADRIGLHPRHDDT